MIVMRSRQRAVIVPPCVLSPGLQAAEKPGRHWGYAFIELLIAYAINIVPLPCPEATFQGYAFGLCRNKHGVDYYKSVEGYVSHCQSLAKSIVKELQSMQKGGYDFICLLGVEHSPTCALNYMYSRSGMLKRPGLFMSSLQNELQDSGMIITQIGINRTYPRKSLTLLEQMLSHNTKEDIID